MTALRRAFLAVVPPPVVLAWTARLTDPSDPTDGLRWARTQQRHLTVQFLGSVPDVDPVVELVADVARAHAPFTASLGGGGAFPNARRASVVWLGVRQGNDALTGLAESLASLANEDRPYRAHLTLARVPRARDVRSLVAVLEGAGESPRWIVDDVVLFDADPRAEGAVHTEQARFPLGG